MSIESSLQAAEAVFQRLSGSAENRVAPKEALDAVRSTLAEASPQVRGLRSSAGLSDCVEAAALSSDGRRDAALFLVRCLGVPGLVADADRDRGEHLQRKIVHLFEQGAPDLVEYFRLPERKQTIDKFEALRDLHRQCTDLLSAFGTLPDDPQELASRRQEVFKTLNNKFLKAYLNTYGFPAMANSVRSILNALCDLLETTDATFGQKLLQLIEEVDAESRTVGERSDFLALDAWRPFLNTSRKVLAQIDRESLDRFKCNLRPRRTLPYVVERRYPLHEPNRIVRVKIPLINDGPGVAIDTTAMIVAGIDNVLVSSEPIDIGTVPPGEFALSFDMLIGTPIAEVPLFVELGWRTARAPDRQINSFDVTLLAQKPNIDWRALEDSDPYSTEVAHGDEFVGRGEKVLALANRILKQHVQSSYITGQKRVGKTSLALAVQDYVKQHAIEPQSIEVIYLEYGDYARKDADSTVKALGEAIAAGLTPFLPPVSHSLRLDFQGSLAPLNQIAQALLATHPNKKFVIVLDEFDEIHPEMYRYGPLAEAFFSNLRTLSAKRNVAVMLVGGENMPFIISAQGDQLNKFIREPLDYFSRSDEWDNFVELARQARQKDAVPLTWHESALSELFNYTNGHPYYTKLLCARIFQNAVSDRDTEITVDEVQRAVTGVVDTLDTNAFAHFWKDGIPQSREEAEVIALKRCRVLVAMARTRRQGRPLSAECIAENKGSALLATSEIVPVLNDFCRREILREKVEYEFVVPLFEQWLVQTGINKLVADTLGDEIAGSIQREEDKAYVTSPEIALLVERWPLYRGRRISTEDVRAWLDQRKSFREQRLLFKLIKNIRFISEDEIREKLRTAHSIVKRHTTAFTPESRAQRRYDIMVTYVDGPAKSGSRYADRYAEENLISTQCVVAPETFAQRVPEHEERRGITVNGVVIVDDFAATGRSLASNLENFVNENSSFLRDRNITVVIIALLATREADEYMRTAIRRLPYKNVDFRVCEVLQDRAYAFREGNGIWASADEATLAKALVVEIGRQIYKNEPLGYGDLGLLVAFNDTVPNNSLPILHAAATNVWRPLIARPKN
jgi:hypothetical protein